MKVKFPILIKGAHQFNTLMVFLKGHDIVWADGDELMNYNDFCKSEGFVKFPIYILYNPPAYNIRGKFCELGSIYYRELNEDWDNKEVEVEI